MLEHPEPHARHATGSEFIKGTISQYYHLHSPGKVILRCLFSWSDIMIITTNRRMRTMMSRPAAPPTAPPTTVKLILFPPTVMKDSWNSCRIFNPRFDHLKKWKLLTQQMPL